MSIVPCPSPPTVVGCIDRDATGGKITSRTADVRVGGTTTFVVLVRNAGTIASPPITLLIFTFEPPWLDAVFTPVACNGCTIHGGTLHDFFLEWPALAPGVHELSVTIAGTALPPDSNGSASEYLWQMCAYAEPLAAVEAYGPIDGQPAFGCWGVATLIRP